MKVCFDTCVIIDFLGKTEGCFNAFVALDTSLLNEFQVCCSTSSTTDIVYLMHSRGFAKTQKEAKESIGNLLSLFTIISNNENDVNAANLSKMKDYEDALIAYSCKRAGVDLIITSNKKDFEHSPVPAITPAEFVKTFKPKNYKYEEIKL